MTDKPSVLFVVQSDTAVTLKEGQLLESKGGMLERSNIPDEGPFGHDATKS